MDGDDRIDARELKAAIRALGFDSVTSAEVRRALVDVGAEDGLVTFGQFCDIMASKIVSWRQDDANFSGRGRST